MYMKQHVNIRNILRYCGILTLVLFFISPALYAQDVTFDAHIDKTRLSFEDVLVLSFSLSGSNLDLNVTPELPDLKEDFDFEVRTTLYPPFIDKDGIMSLAELFGEGQKWVLQQFRQAKNMLNENAYEVTPYTDEEAQGFVRLAKEHSKTDNITLRYV